MDLEDFSRVAQLLQNGKKEDGFDVSVEAERAAVHMLEDPELSVSEKSALNDMYRERSKNARDTERIRREENRTDFILTVLGGLLFVGASVFLGTSSGSYGSQNLIGTGNFWI